MSISLLVGALLVSGAGEAPAPAEPKKKAAARMVCERVEETGTRLGGRRVCLTAEQWAEKRREHRADIERAQQNVGIKNE
jgi:hypothetical protein